MKGFRGKMTTTNTTSALQGGEHVRHKTVVSTNQRIAELRDHLEFLRRNGFLGQDEIESKITELQR